jgi:hypothetical protein
MNAAEQPWGIRAGVSVDGVRCVRQTAHPGWVGTMERTYLSNDSVTRDFMFSNIQLTGQHAKESGFSCNTKGGQLQTMTQCSVIKVRMT